MNLKQYITHNLLNIPGWRTNRKIVVIESDDWGSIRMPSQEVYVIEDTVSILSNVNNETYDRHHKNQW